MKKLYFEVRIWNWATLLHKANYEFESEELASMYALGLFDGFRLSQGATGHGITEVQESEINIEN